MRAGVMTIAARASHARADAGRTLDKVAFAGLAALVAVLALSGRVVPDGDFQLFHEPAIHLVRDGRLVAPGLACLAEDAERFFAVYVPGYFLYWSALYAVFGVALETFQLGAALIQLASIAGLQLFAVALARHVLGVAVTDRWRLVFWIAAALAFASPPHPHPHSLAVPLALFAGALALRAFETGLRPLLAGAALGGLAFVVAPLPAAFTAAFVVLVQAWRRRFRDALVHAALFALAAALLLVAWNAVMPGAIEAILSHALRHIPWSSEFRLTAAYAPEGPASLEAMFALYAGEAHRLLRLAPLLALAIWFAQARGTGGFAVGAAILLLVALAGISGGNPIYLVAVVAVPVAVLCAIVAAGRYRPATAACVLLAAAASGYPALKGLAAHLLVPTDRHYETATATLLASRPVNADAASAIYFFAADRAGVALGNYDYCRAAIRAGTYAPPRLFLTGYAYWRDKAWLGTTYRVAGTPPASHERTFSTFVLRTSNPFDPRPYILVRDAGAR